MNVSRPGLVSACRDCHRYSVTDTGVLSPADGCRLGRRHHPACRGGVQTREIRRSKLYEALDFLEALNRAEVARSQIPAGISMGPAHRTKEQLREILRTTTRGIQQSCVGNLVDRLIELGLQYRENKLEIEELRRQLAIVRKTVRLL